MELLILQEQSSGGSSLKWKTLEHQGPLFPADYKPHGKPLKYNFQLVDLTPNQEEAAMLYAKYINTDYVQNKTFNKNFWNDWKKLLGKDSKIQSLDGCDFTEYKQILIDDVDNKVFTCLKNTLDIIIINNIFS